MKWNKMIALAVTGALSVGMLSACSGTSSNPSGSESGGSGDKVIKIGVFEPSTGDSASGGKKEMLGMQYANY